MAASRKAFLLRVDSSVLEAVQRWANDDLRSLNGQIEFVLRRALAQSGRGMVRSADAPAAPQESVEIDDPPADGDA